MTITPNSQIVEEVEVEVEGENDTIWIPNEVLNKLRNAVIGNGVVAAGLFCVFNATTEILVSQPGVLVFQTVPTFFAFPASVFMAGAVGSSAIKGVNKCVKKIKNAINESTAHEDCSYSVYLATSTLVGIDRNSVAKVIRECYKTAGQILTLKQKLHRVDHWKLVFESNKVNQQCYTIELKDTNGKIGCVFNSIDSDFYTRDKKATYFYLCGFDGSEDEDDLESALKSFKKTHPMNNQRYAISDNNPTIIRQ